MMGAEDGTGTNPDRRGWEEAGMRIFRPLQIGFMNRVLEQDRRFYLIVSATLGVNLQSGRELLEFDFIKDAFACMGDNPLPDMGMPKPSAEVLVSGKCFSTAGKQIPAYDVSIRVGPVNKTLYVFGNRSWVKKGGMVKVISDPEPFTSMEISYNNAFGGPDDPRNPSGKGMAAKTDKGDVQALPNIEDPKHLIGSPGDQPGPAGLGPLDPSWPQRMRFQGTYDADYKIKYYPGYPADLDWRYFLSAPEDQRIKAYFQGNEPFTITHMHPELPTISGALPGLVPRCFALRSKNGGAPEFVELGLNLDTIWFFPEKLLALLTWRKGIEVGDDEASEISHAILAYEDGTKKPRPPEHYQKALELRMNSDDALLNNFSTEDLIPDGHKCAMELLQEMAFEKSEPSEFSKNMDAKADSVKKMADEKIEEAVASSEKNLAGMDFPDDVKAKMPGGGKLDLRKMIKEQSEAKPDPDTAALNAKLESIIPGITAGDPKKIELKKFSFDKIDQVMAAVSEFSAKKEKQGKDLAKEQIDKAKDQIKQQLEQLNQDGATPEEAKAKLEESLKQLEGINFDESPPAPLPRVNAEELIAQLSPVSPMIQEAMQHVQSMKEMGVQNETTQKLEQQIRQSRDTQLRQIEDAMREAETDFKGTYIMGAHFMKDGLSPHKDPVEKVAERLLQAIAQGQDVSGKDWACIDLAGRNLDGVNLSGAFLEQVNFKGAILKGANLAGAIMARAILEDADLSGADLTGANVGGVHAERARFTGANLKAARLSKGDFTGADFKKAELEDVETMEIIVAGAIFAGAHMPGVKFIESAISGAKFPEADLTSSAFIKCEIKDADFSRAVMAGVTFADVQLTNVSFDQADLSKACFAATKPEKAGMTNVRFRGAILKQSNFQNIIMPGTDLQNADLENSNFLGADLTSANLSRAHAPSALFKKARLEGARLDHINLMQGSLAKAYLVNASLAGANLYAVDFLRSTIKNTDFQGANLDSTIIEAWRPK